MSVLSAVAHGNLVDPAAPIVPLEMCLCLLGCAPGDLCFGIEPSGTFHPTMRYFASYNRVRSEKKVENFRKILLGFRLDDAVAHK